MKTLFDFDGTWYKGNLHMHTTRSDGRLAPEAAAELYRKAGYRFLALTDHWIQSKTETENGLLVLSGCEWDVGDAEHPIFHIIGAGMDSQVILKRSPELRPQQIIDAVHAAGGIAVLAHPAWSLTDPSDCIRLKGLAGLEIYNSVSGLPWNGRRSDSSLYVDLCAARGKLFRCMAADDSHFYNGEQTRSFIMVKARELTAGSVKSALIRGNFYASQGPLFDSIRFDGETVEVRYEKAQTVVFYSNSVWCDDRVFTGGGQTALYRIKPSDKYVRVELVDADGNMAWSSPFPVNQV